MGGVVKKHLLKTLVLAGAALMVLAWAVIVLKSPVFDVGWVSAAVIFAAGLALAAFVVFRVHRFAGRLRRFVRHLLAGNYEVGFKMQSKGTDEVAALEVMLEKLVEQLRTYDVLRADRVRATQRAFEVLFENSTQAVLALDLAQESFEANAEARRFFGLPRQVGSLGAVRKIAANAEFLDMIDKAGQTEKRPQQGRVRLHFPAQDSHRDLTVKAVPVKGQDDTVTTVIVFLLPAA